jgi:hypothetical protein
MFVDSFSLCVPFNLHVLFQKGVKVPLGLFQAILYQGKGGMRVEARDIAVNVGVQKIRCWSGSAYACLCTELIQIAEGAAELDA